MDNFVLKSKSKHYLAKNFPCKSTYDCSRKKGSLFESHPPTVTDWLSQVLLSFDQTEVITLTVIEPANHTNVSFL